MLDCVNLFIYNFINLIAYLFTSHHGDIIVQTHNSNDTNEFSDG